MWTPLVGLALGAGLLLAYLGVRRDQRRRQAAVLGRRRKAELDGSAKARLQFPHVDLSRCIGCGTCIRACPENGVLELVHGQAAVVHGARCVGHGLCASECPVGAIAVTLADVETRQDLPALTEDFEAVGTPGLFLAGEVTGYALVRTAIRQGAHVGRVAAGRAASLPRANGELDLCIVGGGPAGLACALEAKRHGLSFAVLERETVGGTVARYPRGKLVMTQPVELPLHGRLKRTSYSKEELMELWEELVREHELPVHPGHQLLDVQRGDHGFRVVTQAGEVEAKQVCLALGRSGTPRKLGVPGEELPKVAYNLLDAQSYTQRDILVVGGGDSAVEAALGLAAQEGNRVTLSYRRARFTRVKSRNELRLAAAQEAGTVQVLPLSEVVRIEEERVVLEVTEGEGHRVLTLPNHHVFVFAGAVAPVELLRACGVSFDPRDRPRAEPLVERGTNLVLALSVALATTLVAGLWVAYHWGYYGADDLERVDSLLHDSLRPGGRLGLWFGVAGSASILANLAYLVRRTPFFRFEWGALGRWMTAHVATGVLAWLLIALHAALAPRSTPGGHAFLALSVLVATGAVGRYLYSFLPRAANGRELELDEIKGRLASLTAEWEGRHRGFGEVVEAEMQELAAATSWRRSLLGKLRALVGSRAALRRSLARLRQRGLAEGVDRGELAQILELARRAHRGYLASAHLEELRGVAASWRYLHRWVALLMVLLAAVHVVVALLYGELGWSGS